MTQEIKHFVAVCSICNANLPKQQKETLHHHDVPARPWSKEGMDLFTVQNVPFLIIVDYYSDFWEVKKVIDTTAACIIDCYKQQFSSRYGIPDSGIVTDNGPQFTSQDFALFAKAWEFHHVPSSPHHSRSNGEAEVSSENSKDSHHKGYAGRHRCVVSHFGVEKYSHRGLQQQSSTALNV